MTRQLNSIIEIAADLVIKGVATEENAIKKAIEIDNDMITKCVREMHYKMEGHVFEDNDFQKAYGIMLDRVYNNLHV